MSENNMGGYISLFPQTLQNVSAPTAPVMGTGNANSGAFGMDGFNFASQGAPKMQGFGNDTTGLLGTSSMDFGGSWLDGLSNFGSNASNSIGNFLGAENSNGSSKLFGEGGIMGGVGSLIGGVGGILGAVNAGKQLKLSKDMYNTQLQAYNQDAANSAQSINTRLEDRQIARIAGQGQKAAQVRYGSLNDYMDKNRVTVKNIG